MFCSLTTHMYDDCDDERDEEEDVCESEIEMLWTIRRKGWTKSWGRPASKESM